MLLSSLGVMLRGGTFHSLLSLFCIHTVRSIAVGGLVSTVPHNISYCSFVFQSGFKGGGDSLNTFPLVRLGEQRAGQMWTGPDRQTRNSSPVLLRTQFDIPLCHTVLMVRFLVIVESQRSALSHQILGLFDTH